MTSHTSILAKIRAAIPQGTASRLRARAADPMADPLARQNRAEWRERFAAELRALGGEVRTGSEQDIATYVHSRLEVLRYGDGRLPPVMTWQAESLPRPGLIDRLRLEGVEMLGPIVPADEPARMQRLGELADAGLGITGADAAIAETGTLVLRDGPGRGRLASLLPPIHVALVNEERIYPTFEAYLDATPPAVDSTLTLVTGPSRTADIEMTLTIGVHGPREVVVWIVADE